MSSKRREGVVLVARKDDEYWFVDSVFRHDDDLSGCTGTSVWPVSEAHADYLLELDNVADRYYDCWLESAGGMIDAECTRCLAGADEDGCPRCGYESVNSFCERVVAYDGIDAMIDDLGEAYADALNEHADLDDKAEYADCSGCGRIFGRVSLDDFDEVYNRKALVAVLAYEDGAVDYDYACRVIYGD
jgi:hypothetical protein